MSYSGPLKTGNPYDHEGKVIHVGTPGIFHKLAAGSFGRLTKCGRDASDARCTDHRLADQQPCVVCWPSDVSPSPRSQPAGHASSRTTTDLYVHLDARDVLADLAIIEGRG